MLKFCVQSHNTNTLICLLQMTHIKLSTTINTIAEKNINYVAINYCMIRLLHFNVLTHSST